jgi:D-arabinose 1-dehydrogenase-like Zn-dependent alcohol dehydrogenase
MGVKFAYALGAHVVMITYLRKGKKTLLRLGALEVLMSERSR